MVVWLLKNGRNGQIIEACDDETNASTLKANLIKTGEYDAINIEAVEVNQDYIEPLSVVSVRGDMKPQGPNFTIKAYNPQSAVEDTLYFNVSGNYISYNGWVNLTAGEKALSDTEALKQRISNLISTQLKIRLMNDNPM